MYGIHGAYAPDIHKEEKDLEIAIEDEINDKIREDVACTNIGNIYELRIQYDLAFKYYKQALNAAATPTIKNTN